MSPLFKSYFKTTAACVALAVAAVVVALLALRWLPRVFGPLIAPVSVLFALIAAILACAGAVVLIRYGRITRGERDLFLELNRSREPQAIEAGELPRATALRRWLARRLLGHELLTGDLVEIRPWAEIAATLDAQGCLEQLPFMPEMLAMCGRRARVFRCAHRLFDYRKSRRMRHMDGVVLLAGAVCDGASHGHCEAACHTIWKAAWLRRVPHTERTGITPLSSDSPVRTGAAVPQLGTAEPRYVCQLTQLNAASHRVGRLGVAELVRPLVAGNVSPGAFVVASLTYAFNELQQLRGGYAFPEFESTLQEPDKSDEPALQAGDRVVVRSAAEIRATLNARLEHRGLGFESDMLKHCGHGYCVQAQIRKVIDIVTGEMRLLKTPAYTLRQVHFSGERQFFNSQYEPLFWRGAWLQRKGGSVSATSGGTICDP